MSEISKTTLDETVVQQEDSKEFVINSFDTLVAYLGEVALNVPDAVLKVLKYRK